MAFKDTDVNDVREYSREMGKKPENNFWPIDGYCNKKGYFFFAEAVKREFLLLNNGK